MKSLDLTDDTVQAGLKQFFAFMREILSEKHFRLLLGALAILLGRGAVTFLHEMSGASKQRIAKGRKEITENDPIVRSSRTRRKGGGRKRTEKKMPRILTWLRELINRSSYGNPENEKCRIYSTMSLAKMCKALEKVGIIVCENTILRLVRKIGFTKQINRKSLQIGKPHPDSEEQMQLVTDMKNGFANNAATPTVSVDAKAKVSILNLFQKGSEWREKGDARDVLDHDFIPKNRKATPYGIYDICQNLGFVNVGISFDTAQFAVESIRRWWNQVGKAMYPGADRIIILCDGGGSNGWRVRLWKYELAKLAEEIGLPIEVHHYPPGKSRFNAVEHRLFNRISMNWAGQPMTDLQTLLRFICATETAPGKNVRAVLDESVYEKGTKVADSDFERINIVRSPRLGFWNYTIYGFQNADSDAQAA